MNKKDQILELLHEVKDPEIPVVSVVEMGMVRDVEITDDKTTVVITPTYSGCPAMYEIRKNVVAKLKNEGFGKVAVREQLSPAWTTDWMTDSTKEKLREFGIAPPDKSTGESIVKLFEKEKPVQCPYCGSEETKLESRFGPTACKSLHYCNSCSQPFEHFKCH